MKRLAPPCRIRWCSIATIISEYLPSSNVTYEYVVVPGVGAEEDYEGLNVSGKLALIQRGQTNFEDKLAIAVSHGAKGAIIYNNISGALAPAFSTWRGYMIGIALEDGEKLLAAAVDGVGTVTFGPASSSDYNWNTPADVEKTPWTAVMPAYDAGQMSSFSSAGPAPDLSLKPEISAPGGNIISSVIGGGYGIMSGTSMATPHMAGVAALVRNYLRSELDVTDSDALRNMAECLMMSTAVPGKNDNGAEFSPRQQGAGLVDVEQAVTAEGYLSVNGKDGVQWPKAELGWNETGTYAFSFDVHNISGEAVTYTLTASSLTEGIANQDGVDFSDGVTQRLDENDFTVTYSGDAVNGTVTVPANGTATVTVSLALSASYKAELFSNFPNGNYVEGYVYLQPADGVTLVLPYLGFCGDWTDGVVFEDGPESSYLMQPTLFATGRRPVVQDHRRGHGPADRQSQCGKQLFRHLSRRARRAGDSRNRLRRRIGLHRHDHRHQSILSVQPDHQRHPARHHPGHRRQSLPVILVQLRRDQHQPARGPGGDRRFRLLSVRQRELPAA